MDTFDIDGSGINTYTTQEVDINGFKMPHRFYIKNSMDYQMMINRYLKLNNKPRFNGEVVPLGSSYGNLESYTGYY